MPKRGSVQLLLLSLCPRATRRLGIGAAVAILLLAGLLPFKDGVPRFAENGIVQALHQSAWKRALAGQSNAPHWPWEDPSVNMSFAPGSKVPRLGLSATMLKYADDAVEPASPQPHHAARTTPNTTTEPLGDVAISDVAIGDSITFTAADGATCVYRVTGRRVVDPHLAGSEAESLQGAMSLFNCGPLDRLIMQATQGALTDEEPPVAPETVDDQRKL